MSWLRHILAANLANLVASLQHPAAGIFTWNESWPPSSISLRGCWTRAWWRRAARPVNGPVPRAGRASG